MTSAAAILVVGVGWATPAGAHPDADDHGSIALSATGDLGGPPTVTGTFFGGSALGVYVEYIHSVSLTATPVGPTGGGPVSADGCALVTAGKCGTGTVSFRWSMPPLAYNGPYVVNATADHCPVFCGSAGPATVTPREFRLAADPEAPADVRADPGADRNVVLSWQRNPEPDILFYQVSRKEGGGNFSRVGGDIRQPESGRPTFTDTSTSGTAGGEFAYRVVAVRKGASGDGDTTRTSGASGDRSVTVAPPPSNIPPGGPGGEVKPAGSDTNIGGYLAGRPPALPSPRPRFMDLPDTGYDGSLPFGQLPAEDMSEPGEEDAIPATLETRRLQEFNRGRPLIPIAAGAILLLLAAHLRLFNKRLKTDSPRRKSSAAEFIAALDASKRAHMPLDVEAAVANGGHHRQSSGATLADLPEWGQLRGVTLLPAAPEAEDVDDAAWGAEASPADGVADPDPVVDEEEFEPAEVHDAVLEHAEINEAAEGLEQDGADSDVDATAVDVADAEAEPDEERELVAELEQGEDYEVVSALEQYEDYDTDDELEQDEELEEYEVVSELEEYEVADDESEPYQLEQDELTLAELERDEEAGIRLEAAEVYGAAVELEEDDAVEVDEEYGVVAAHDAAAEYNGVAGQMQVGDEFLVELEQDDEAEIVSELVPRSGPVVMPYTEVVADPEPDVVGDELPAAAPAAAAAAGAGSTNGSGNGSTNGSGNEATNGSSDGDPMTDLDDFEWSEEAQFAEPQVEVFVGPRR